MKKTLIFLTLFLLSNPYSIASEKCSVSESALQRFLAMDYIAFDQSPPKGGWRSLADQGCDLDVADLIDRYCQKNKEKLLPEQIATLTFHTGQIYADQGLTELALERLKRSFDPKLDAKYHWNSYVEGTIAFLEKDSIKLRAARDKVFSLEKDHPYVNTLGNLIKCFGRSYKQVGPDCDQPVKPAN